MYSRLVVGAAVGLVRGLKVRGPETEQKARSLFSPRFFGPKPACSSIHVKQVYHTRIPPENPLCLHSLVQHRRLSKTTDISGEALRTEIDEINRDFSEAREEIELAFESKETVYFNEEAETARHAVEKVIDRFENLKSRLSDDERGQLQRSMGLKMEQLRGELHRMNEE